MKNIPLIQAVDKVVALKLKAIDRIVEDLVEPLSDVGNPEKLIKKPYAQWTPEDLALLTRIYGVGDDSPLSQLIFNREYERVKELEREEKQNA